MALYTFSVSTPVGGVKSDPDPHALSTKQWFTMNQVRARLGIVSNFPGWATILAAAQSVGSLTTLLKEYRLQSGSTFLVAGSNSKIWKYVPSTKVLTDITGAAVLAATRLEPWSAAVYLDKLYITSKDNGLYKLTCSGNIANIAAAPIGWHIGIQNDHICFLGVGTVPQRFQWAAEGTEDTWTATISNDAGSSDLIDKPDFGIGLRNLGDTIVAYFEDRIIPISYVGGNDVFSVGRTVVDTGAVNEYAIAPFSDIHFGMGANFFFTYRGGSTIDDSIGDAIRERVYTRLNKPLKSLARCLVYHPTYEIIFAYPSVDATLNCDECVVYN